MRKVLIFKSMSLDGFIAGPDDEIDLPQSWRVSRRCVGRGAGDRDVDEGDGVAALGMLGGASSRSVK